MENDAERLDFPIYQGELVTVGLFRCSPGHPRFNNSGPTRASLLVFPRTSVKITHAGQAPVVATPNVVMFYNPRQEYRRERVCERGDHCEWFSFDSGMLLEALHPYDRQAAGYPGRPFRYTHAHSDATTYLLQRRVVEHLLTNERPDRLYVEETLLQVLSRSLANAYGRPSARLRNQAARRALVERMQTLLAARFEAQLGEADTAQTDNPLTLEAIAGELHYSPFHLCRIFQEETGGSIHQYLNGLRLRTSLEWIAAGSELGELALRLGYSSRSHFTLAFRRQFGTPPSAMRAILKMPVVS